VVHHEGQGFPPNRFAGPSIEYHTVHDVEGLLFYIVENTFAVVPRRVRRVRGVRGKRGVRGLKGVRGASRE
jgi:hypothetical protein